MKVAVTRMASATDNRVSTSLPSAVLRHRLPFVFLLALCIRLVVPAIGPWHDQRRAFSANSGR
ncbi:MAG: hypothetical protein C5B56_15210 [Proteobacteria bacterium]|nr:MAG: hypothetical protein C5B56_15210 [Pseudomonadota bacterium]